MTSTIARTETNSPADLAALIHNDVLQSLGVAVLGVDLCRRFHQQMRYEQALEEIMGIVDALGMALASSEQLLPDLLRALPASRPGPSRPSLVVLDTAPGFATTRLPAANRPAADPREIVETLTACQIQARRCRGQYDAGLGEETMRDLELMLQRLEFVAVAFRQVMGQLRQGLPLPLAGRPVVVAWTRSA